MDQIEKPVSLKIKSDTEEELGQVRKRNIQADYSRKRMAALKRKKELQVGEAPAGSHQGVFPGDGVFYVFLALGLTIGLVNDFFDLVMLNRFFLLAQTLDIVALFLLLFVLAFLFRSFAALTAIVLLAFVLEVLPVVGVVPWWTVAVIMWYIFSRGNKGQ
ncbi:MAG: hypothetical protein FJZ04_02705 [Candidatus Moranbacteria bacterium]|nr:hypothetical protein [Candidatus Moranbacteria bacterium]